MPSLITFKRRASRFLLSRRGFNLVELLVVIGIIAILAGVALGPITSGIQKAKQSGAVQESHALGLAMYSAANDNNQTYPDSTATNASDVAKTLLAGGYVTDPSIFYISGGSASKYTGAAASAVSGIQNSNISWDFAGATGVGLNSTQAQFAPLLWSSIKNDTGATEVNVAGYSTAGTAITAVAGTNSAFGQAGIATFYINNSAAFVVASGSGYTCTLVTTANNSGGLSSSLTPSINAGGG